MNATVIHNIFNIVYIGIIAAMSTYSWFLNLEGEKLYLLSVTCLLYYFVDTAFIAIRPDSVNSPKTILLHHILSFSLALGAYMAPDYRSLCVQYILIDVNTWFLVVRQTLKERYLAIEVPFYTTWVLIRLVHYPYLMLKVAVRFPESFVWKGMTVITLFLNMMNLKWSIALFRRVLSSKTDKDYKL